MDSQFIIEKYYTKGSDLYNLLLKHSMQVRDKALSVLLKHPELGADKNFVSEAAMLHDIGIYLCDAPEIFCHGTHDYIEHGYLGAEILLKEGLRKHALVAERHTGTGISLEEIISKKMPLPPRDMQPQSIEEKIICYADKFYSKSKPQQELSVEKIRQSLGKFGKDKVEKFDEWHELFC